MKRKFLERAQARGAARTQSTSPTKNSTIFKLKNEILFEGDLEIDQIINPALKVDNVSP